MTADGRARLWTSLRHPKLVHQTSSFTADDRYPELFRLVRSLAPDARRLLSFGCSTGEEILSLRKLFPEAAIVGADINARSRKMAARLLGADDCVAIVRPENIQGKFDVILALSVFQRRPHEVMESGLMNIHRLYPFDRFDEEISRLVDRTIDGGILCVVNAQYRVEDCAAASNLTAVLEAPDMIPPIFDRNGWSLAGTTAKTIFRKN